MRKLFYLLLFPLIFYFTSCATYVDKKLGKIPFNIKMKDSIIRFASFTSDKKSNTLHYELKRKFTRDIEVFYPIRYSINLPKKVKDLDVGWLGRAWIDYGSNQFIIIVQNENPGSYEADTITDEDWQRLVRSKFEIGQLHNLKLDEINLIRGRHNMILTKDSISIVLSNVKPKNIKKFLSSVRTLKIVR